MPIGRNALLLIGVSLVAGFGGTAMSLAASVWVLTLTGSASLAALAGFCVFAPTLAGPLLGALVDRLPGRTLLVCTQLGLAALLLTLFAVRSRSELWLLYTVMVCYGISYVLLDAGESALLPRVLPLAAFGRVNGWRRSAQEGTKLVAPLVGAGLFSWAGGPSVAALSAGALVVAAGFYPLLRVRDAEPEAVERRQIRAGVEYLWTRPGLRAIVLLGGVSVAMSGLATAACYQVIVEDLHRPAAFAGVLAAAQGAGSIVGGLVAGRAQERFGEPVLAAAGAVLFAVGVGLRAAPWTATSVLGSVVIGIGLPWTVIASMTAVQRLTPTGLLGRVSATATTLTFAPTALAIPLGAAAITVVDHRLVLVLTGIVTVVAAVQAIRVPIAGAARP